MRRLGITAFVLAMMAGFQSAAAPLEAYGRLPDVEQVAISPDGRMLAEVTTDGERRTLLIQDAGTRRTAIQLNIADKKLRSLQWAGPNHVVVTVSVTGKIANVDGPRLEYLLPIDVDWVKNTQRPLLWGVPQSLNVILGTPQFRFFGGRPFAYVTGIAFVHDRGRLTLFRVDMDAGVSSIQAVGFFDTTGFVVDAHGQAIAQTEYDAPMSRWGLDLLGKDQWVEVDHANIPVGPPEVAGLGRDGTSIALIFGGDDGDVVRELKPGATAYGDPISAGDAVDLIWDPATYRLIGHRTLIGDEQRYQFFDAGDQNIWDAVSAAFPGAQVAPVSFTDDHQTFVIRVEPAAGGPAYFLVSSLGKSVRKIDDEYAGLTEKDVAPVHPVAFKARDGLALSGYLTLPRGREPRSLPLVVFPHGGPAARDEPGFDWWAQAMASRGYAVLQVNYRGSAGFGAKFQSAGFGQWGRLMQTDISDGVHYLASQGAIDPARVCIVGASYGGYAALAGVTLDPGVYRCAASIAGPSDLKEMINWQTSRQGIEAAETRRYWTQYMGAPATFDQISPARLAEKVSVPVLLVHGKDDTVVDYHQSQIMADALARAGKPFEFVTLKAEDHWLSRGATRLEMLQAVVDFLEKYNPPG